MIEQLKFAYSPLGKAKKKKIIIKDQARKQD